MCGVRCIQHWPSVTLVLHPLKVTCSVSPPVSSCFLQEVLRTSVIEMVLATDMKQHFAIHGMFQAKLNHLANSRTGSSPALATTHPAQQGAPSPGSLVTSAGGGGAAGDLQPRDVVPCVGGEVSV